MGPRPHCAPGNQAHSVGVRPVQPFSSSFWKAAAKSVKNLALSLAYCFVYFKNFLSVSLCGHQLSDAPRHRRDVVLVTASARFPHRFQYEDPSKKLMMLPSDLLLVTDKKFAKYTKQYAKDNAMFFKDFAAAFQKLEENGCSGLTPTEWA